MKPMWAKIVGIGIGIKPCDAYYIPFVPFHDHLRDFFHSYQGTIFGHNIKYDWHIFHNANIKIPHISFDTILASYLLHPETRRHNLDELALEHFNKVKIPITDLIGSGKNTIGMDKVPEERVKEYCCEDVDYTIRLKNLFYPQLKSEGLETLLKEIEVPLIPILAKMERIGIFLDAPMLARYGNELKQEIETLKHEIFSTIGEEFNLNSPKQLSHILFEKLQLALPGKNRTSTSTSADVLEELAIETPIVRRILDYRTLEKMRSTYVDALAEEIHPETGRIHCTFNQSVAATGRLSCQDPNLQNIPVRGKQGERIRECFRPNRSSYSFVGADYSQIELRLLAHFSEDPALIRAFHNGEDIHASTASQIFNIPINEISTEMRSKAKAINFGILYGQSAYGLSRQTGLTLSEAGQFIDTYFDRFPKVREYIEECKNRARKLGYAETLLGRRRPLVDIHSKNPTLRAASERLAVNTPLQGTAADLIKKAMIHIDRAISQNHLKSRMILQIHDELIFEGPDHEVSDLITLIPKEMEHIFTLKVPLKISVVVGKNWNEC